MTDLVPLDEGASTAFLRTAEFSLSYDVSGPSCTGQFGRIRVVPERAVVTVRMDGVATTAARLTVYGKRANKDGSPGVLPAAASFGLSWQRGSVPEWLLELTEDAVRSVVEWTNPVTAETSDWHHTFAELYRYRMLYNAALFNEWARDYRYDVHKSERHHDGEECFGGGWFIVVAQLPTGQISNHYPMSDWYRFRVPEFPLAAEWDGHTPEQAAQRLEAFIAATTEETTP